jgi:hypothetical protein
LSLFSKDCTVKQAIDAFRTFTHQFFTHARSAEPSLGNNLVRAFKGWLSDGIYDESALEDALATHFGSDAKLFGCKYLHSSGIKLGVTATTVRNTSARIFTNYNGVIARPKNNGRVPLNHCKPLRERLTAHRLSPCAPAARRTRAIALASVSVGSSHISKTTC